MAQIIGLCAERLRRMLAVVTQQSSDEELALVTEILAVTTLLVAAELDLGDAYAA